MISFEPSRRLLWILQIETDLLDTPSPSYTESKIVRGFLQQTQLRLLEVPSEEYMCAGVLQKRRSISRQQARSEW